MGTYTAKAVAYDNAGNVSLAATDSARTLMYAWSKWNVSTVSSSQIVKLPLLCTANDRLQYNFVPRRSDGGTIQQLIYQTNVSGTLLID